MIGHVHNFYIQVLLAFLAVASPVDVSTEHTKQ
jgi:hypothetical protein